jgi:tetratricopeptide (TPR) repeat protein
MRRLALASLLALASAAPGRAAERPWTLVRSQNLTVVGQQSARTLRAVAVELEQFRIVLGGLIQNAQRPLALPTVVYVFGSHKELEPFLPMHDGKPAALAGYFHHDDETYDIALALDGYEESARIVFHEYAHLLVQNATRTIPVWLNEGLAEYYSTYALDPAGKRAAIGRPIVEHIALLRDRFMTLSQLIAVGTSSALYNESDRRSIFYAEAWALTHFLMVQVPNGPAGINRYATGIARGGDPDNVFQEAFGKTPAAFEKDLRAYVRSVAFKSGVFAFPEKINVEAPDSGRTMTPAEAAAWAGDLQMRAGRVEEAKARIENAAAAAPDAAMAQLALARLRVHENRPADAWPAFARAMTLAPGDFSAPFAYGVSLLRVDADSGVVPGTTSGVEEARRALAKAASINPSSSEAFAWLAYAEMLSSGRLPQAMAAIRRAIDLAPGRIDYALRFADICILGNALAEARTVLAEIARVTTDPAAAAGATRRLVALDEREASMRGAAAAVAERRDARDPVSLAAAPPDNPPNVATIELDPEPERAKREAEHFTLRKVQRGEERAYGELKEIECGAAEVRVHLKVGSRTIVARARRIEDIALTEFLGSRDFRVACGTREPADSVYLTWRAAPPRVESGTTIVGQAVALEFVPRGFTP